MMPIGMYHMSQVMGFNFARIGYDSPAAMYYDFQESGTAHVIAFFNYVLSDPDLLEAVATKDWDQIARLYNGAGNVDVYAPRLEDAYNRRLVVA